MTLKSCCQHCGQHIEHPVNMVGEIVKCPNCGRQTLLQDRPGSLDISPLVMLLVLFLMIWAWHFQQLTNVAGVDPVQMMELAAWRAAGCLLLLGLYLVPTFIAVRARSRNAMGIGLLNILLGWTLLGWVGALIWSVYKPAR